MSLVISIIALSATMLCIGVILGRLEIGVKKAPLPKPDTEAEMNAEKEIKRQQRVNEQFNSYDGYDN